MEIRTARTGRETGTWKVEELQRLVDRGDVLPSDLVWTQGFLEWKPLSEAWNEIGIRPPAQVAPPIPGSQPPPLNSAIYRDEARSMGDAASNADLTGLTFRRRTQRNSGFNTVRRIAFALALVAAGFAFMKVGLPWASERIASNPDIEELSSSNRSADRSASGANPSNPSEFCKDKLFLGEHFTYQLRSYGADMETLRVIHALISDGQFELLNLRVENGYCMATIRVQGTIRGNSFSRTLEGQMFTPSDVLDGSPDSSAVTSTPLPTDTPRLVGSVSPTDPSPDLAQPAESPPAQDAETEIEASPVVTSRDVVIEPKAPKYPAEEQRLGIEGSVMLVIEVGTSGELLGVVVEKSSGNSNLDEAAVEAAQSWRFEPAMRDGKAIVSKTRIPVDFNLQ